MPPSTGEAHADGGRGGRDGAPAGVPGSFELRAPRAGEGTLAEAVARIGEQARGGDASVGADDHA